MADLYDFTKDLQPTLDQRVWYFINAGLVAAVPVCTWQRSPAGVARLPMLPYGPVAWPC